MRRNVDHLDEARGWLETTTPREQQENATMAVAYALVAVGESADVIAKALEGISISLDRISASLGALVDLIQETSP